MTTVTVIVIGSHDIEKSIECSGTNDIIQHGNSMLTS